MVLEILRSPMSSTPPCDRSILLPAADVVENCWVHMTQQTREMDGKQEYLAWLNGSKAVKLLYGSDYGVVDNAEVAP